MYPGWVFHTGSTALIAVRSTELIFCNSPFVGHEAVEPEALVLLFPGYHTSKPCVRTGRTQAITALHVKAMGRPRKFNIVKYIYTL